MTQRQKVLKFFKKHNKRVFAPHQIQQTVLPTAPLTSVRRAITELTQEGELKIASKRVTGMFGKDVNTWKLK